MLVERSVLHQSAVGSLFSQLGKSENPDAPSFEQHFAQTVEALAPREQTPRRQPQESIDQDVTASRPRAETRRDDDAPVRDVDADAAETPDAGPVETTSQPDRSTPDDRVRNKDAKTEPVAEKATADTSGDGPKTDTPKPQEQAPAPRQAQAKVAMLKELISGGRNLVGALVVEPAAAEAELAKAAKGQAKAADAVKGQAPTRVVDALRLDAAQVGEDAEIQAAASETSIVASQDSSQQQSRRSAGVSFKQNSQQAAAGQAAVVAKVEAAEQGTSDAAQPQQQKPSATSAVQAAKAPSVQTATLSAEVVSVQVVSTSGNEGATSSGGGDAQAVAKVAGPSLEGRPTNVKPVRETAQTQASGADEQIERIVRVMRASISRGGSRVNMRLDPPELGQLRIQMQIRNGEMVARFETQTDSARNWVHSQLGSLRESLAGQNIRLVQASVENRGPGSEQTGGQAGGTGGFTGGHEAGGQQPQQHNAPGQESAPESEILWWTEPAAHDNEVNVVV